MVGEPGDICLIYLMSWRFAVSPFSVTIGTETGRGVVGERDGYLCDVVDNIARSILPVSWFRKTGDLSSEKAVWARGENVLFAGDAMCFVSVSFMDAASFWPVSLSFTDCRFLLCASRIAASFSVLPGLPFLLASVCVLHGLPLPSDQCLCPSRIAASFWAVSGPSPNGRLLSAEYWRLKSVPLMCKRRRVSFSSLQFVASLPPAQYRTCGVGAVSYTHLTLPTRSTV